MQTIKPISLTDGAPVQLFPLSTVVFISMLKDAFEDYKRYVSDKDENVDKKAQVYSKEKRGLDEIEWQKIKVGSIVKVEENQYVPADMILLHSSGTKGTCYVETKNLDGETNLKLKQT